MANGCITVLGLAPDTLALYVLDVPGSRPFQVYSFIPLSKQLPLKELVPHSARHCLQKFKSPNMALFESLRLCNIVALIEASISNDWLENTAVWLTKWRAESEQPGFQRQGAHRLGSEPRLTLEPVHP